jgi:uncharacterized membrane protein YbhN (UPF0104 family)
VTQDRQNPDDEAADRHHGPHLPHPHLPHLRLDEIGGDDLLEAVVESALERADGGDGGAPAHRGSRAARLVSVVGLVLGGLAVAFVVRRLVKDWPEVSDQIGDADVTWLVGAGVLAVAGMTSIAWGWRHVMRTLDTGAPLHKVIAWYYVGELGKYVPGGVWPVLGRGELARRGGVPRTRSYTSVALSLGMLYLAAMFTAAAFLPFAIAGGGGFSPWMLFLLALPVGVVLLHHDVLDKLIGVVSRATKRNVNVLVPRWGDSLVLVARYVPTWLFIGGATYAVTRSLTPDVSFPRMMFATILSWVVGFLAVPVPSGAGIRETVLFAASGLPQSTAITTAVGARILFVVVDVVGALACLPFVRHQPVVLAPDDDLEPMPDDGAALGPEPA